MSDTKTCGSCGLDNMFFNGINYECPDCDYEEKPSNLNSDDDLEDDDELEDDLDDNDELAN